MYDKIEKILNGRRLYSWGRTLGLTDGKITNMKNGKVPDGELLSLIQHVENVNLKWFLNDIITVNCVCPGPVHTGITQGIPDENKETFANRRTALRRYAQPEEVAHATLSLVLPAASFITGATLVVDGGVTIRNA